MMTRLTGNREDQEAVDLAVGRDREGRLAPSGSALEIAGMLALLDDRHDEARQFFNEATSGFADRGYGGSAGVFAVMACRLGDLEQARRLCDRSFEEQGPHVSLRDAALLAHVCAWQGDSNGLQRANGAARLAEQDVDIAARMTLEYAHGLADLLSGDVRDAWDKLRKVCDTLASAGFAETSRVPALPDAIEAAAAAGALTDAEQLCERLTAVSEAVDSRWGRAGVLRSRGHIALARADAAAAAELFLQAADAYEAIALPLERARAMLGAGTAIRRTGRRRQAEAWLLDCQRVFDQAGARPLSQTAAAELARLGGRRRETSLTAAEREVSDLAAAGLRNTEIAARLHISPKTVENHLGRIYRKLGLRGRAELAALKPEER